MVWKRLLVALALVGAAGCGKAETSTPNQPENLATQNLPATCTLDENCLTDNPCEIPVCNNPTGGIGAGTCIFTKAPNGITCDDKNPCTDDTKCSNGVCDNGKPVTCPSSDPCKVGTCNSSTGCIFTPISYDDGDPCNGIETCVVDPKTGKAKKQKGTPLADNVSCTDDGDVCTRDACSGGKCTHKAKTTEQLQREVGACFVATGCKKSAITGQPVSYGSACNDGNTCTSNDYCDGSGTCKGISETTSACGFSEPDPPVNLPLPAPPGRGPSASVGAVPGSFGVSSSGAATYSIPFQLPPGRMGMAPSLGLEYSSDAGNGIAGVGFSVAGLSSIHRCSLARSGIERAIREVDYTDNDALCLDGKRLLPTQGRGSNEFRTLPDSFAKIIRHGSGQDRWFEVRHKSGLISFYGWDGSGPNQGARPLAQNGNAQSWKIYSTADRFGNAIRYEYEQDTVEDQLQGSYAADTRIKQISYPPSNAVVFSYSEEDRPDARFFFSKGMRLSMNKRLTQIDTFFDGSNHVRSYGLEYEPVEVSGGVGAGPQTIPHHPSKRSRLHLVTECDREGVCKPGTIFTWNQGSEGFEIVARDIGKGPTSKSSSIFPVDVDQDGRDDLIFPDSLGGLAFTPCTGSPDIQECEPQQKCLQGGCANPCSTSAPACPEGLECRLDFQACVPPGGVPFSSVILPGQSLSVFRASDTGPGLVADPSKGGTFNLNSLPTFLPFDFNGDKVTDLLLVSEYKHVNPSYPGPGVGYFYTILLGPDYKGFISSNIPRPIENHSNNILNGSTHFADLDGNGFADLIQCWGASETDANDHRWTYWLHSGNNSAIPALPPSQQNSFVQEGPQPIPELNGVRCNNPSFAIDTNGDGVVEYVIGSNSDSEPAKVVRLRVESPIGSSNPGQPDVYPVNVSNFSVTLEKDPGLANNPAPVVADVNGDGLKDIIKTSFVGHEPGASLTDPTKKIFNTAVHLNLGNGEFSGAFFGPALLRSSPHLLKMSLVVDYNGDGMDDLLVPNLYEAPDLDHAFWEAWISNGTSFTRTSTNILFEGRTPFLDVMEEIRSQAIQGRSETRYQSYRASDLDGDGVPDLVGISRSGRIIVRKSNLKEEDTLRAIDDGLSYRFPGDPGYVPSISIEYTHLVDGNGTYQKNANVVCSSDADPPINCVKGGKRVVRSHQVTNGRGLLGEPEVNQQNRFSYFYKDGLFATDARQWLGFSERTVVQEQAVAAGAAPSWQPIRVHMERFGQQLLQKNGIFPLVGAPTRSVSVEQGKSTNTFQQEDFAYTVQDTFQLVGQKTFFTAVKDRISISGDIPVPTPPAPNTISKDLSGIAPNIHKHSAFNVLLFDSFGNIRSSQTLSQLKGKAGIKTTSTVNYLNDISNWIIGRPTLSAICQFSEDLSDADGCLSNTTTYDSKGYVASAVFDSANPQKAIKTTIWRDSFGNVTGEISQDTHGDIRQTWTFYDDGGWYPYASQNDLGHFSFVSFDRPFGLVAQKMDPNNVLVQASYDGFGRLVKVFSPEQETTLIARERVQDSALGVWLSKITTVSSTGETSTRVYNNIGQVLSASTLGFAGERLYKAYGYDALGEHTAKESLTRKTDPNTINPNEYISAMAQAQAYTWEYDVAGRIVKETDPDNKSTEHYYDLEGTSFAVTPKGSIVSHASDLQGRLVATETTKDNASWGKVSYTYGAFGSVKVMAPGDKTGTILLKDYRGQLVYRSDPNRGEAFFEYNSFGELVREKRHADGLYETRFTYDSLGRPIKKEVLDRALDSTEITKWTWDTAPNGIGKLAKAESPDGHEEAYEYDVFGRASKIHTTTKPPANGSNAPETYTTKVTYSKGRIASVDYPKGSGEPTLKIEYDYSPEGLLTAIYGTQGHDPTALIWQWEETDERGRLKRDRTGDHLVTRYDFNPLNGLLEHLETGPDESEALQSFSYSYDNNQNLRSQTDLVHNLTETFTHDPLDRLTKSTIGSTSTNYEYELNGNIKRIWKSTVSSQGPPDAWTYDAAHPQAVRKANRDGIKYDFDNDRLGRRFRQSKGGSQQRIEYNSFDKPRWISPSDNPNHPQAVRFSYDANNQRLLKDSSKERTLYVQGLYEKTYDKKTKETTVRRTVSHGGSGVATFVDKKGGTSATWVSRTLYTHADRLGSPTLITNANGTVYERRSYDAFGLRRSAEDWTQPAPSLLAPLTSGFTGHEEDDELGLINMKGRIYDPITARFLSPDPIVSLPTFSQSWNRYSYVFNSPLGFVDPSGFSPCTGENQSCVTGEATTTRTSENGATTTSGGESYSTSCSGCSTGNQSTIGDWPYTPPANQDDSHGSSAGPQTRQIVPQINPKFLITISGDKYNPVSESGRGQNDLFGSPQTPLPIFTPEQERALRKMSGVLVVPLSMVPGLALFDALIDENKTKKDVAEAAAKEVVTFGVLKILGTGLKVVGSGLATHGPVIAAAARNMWGQTLKQEVSAQVRAVPGQYKVWGQCFKFAAELKKKLEFSLTPGGKGIAPGNRHFIVISPPKNRQLASISLGQERGLNGGFPLGLGNGVDHHAIEVNGIVYDNMRPHGISAEKFLKDFTNNLSHDPNEWLSITVTPF